MKARTSITNMPRSGIREIMDLAWRTPGCTHLEVGEPDFGTPMHIQAGAIEAISEGKTRYTPNAGIMELREAIANKVERVNGFSALPEDVIVSAGAVEAIYASLVTVLNPGDEILLPDPGWPNFRMMADLLAATAVYYPLKQGNGFLPDPEEIGRLITPRTKVILVNFPSNPLGSVANETLIRDLYKVARKHDLLIVSDECYDQITFGTTSPSPKAIDEDGRVIATYSFSKTYAMTGWRVGYAVVPSSISGTLSKVQEPLISCVSGPAQHAAVAALSGPQNCVTEMVSAYQARRDAALAACDRHSLTYLVPQGAFYLWISIENRESTNFALDLVARKQVALAPGSAFGAQGDGWVRVSLANSAESVVHGINAIAELMIELNSQEMKV